MTENEIILLHDRLYEYLKGLHQANPTFGFDTQNEAKSKGCWFHHGGQLFLVLNGRAKNVPSFTIHYQYNSSNWLCWIHEQDLSYKIKTNSKSKLKQPMELLNNLLISLGFSKKGDWQRSFHIGDDFIQSFDSFVKHELTAIHDFFKKKLRLLETEKDDITSNYIDAVEKEKQLGHVKERYRLLKDTTIPHLPFALSRLEVIDFQGIKHLTIEDIPTNVQWIFLTGENGFGKTSVLRAIALGLVGDEYADQQYLGTTQIFSNGYNWNQPFQYSVLPQQLAKNDFQIATYGASRFQLVHRDAADAKDSKSNKKTYSLFYTDGLLKNIERVLIDAERDDPTTFERLKMVFLKILPNLGDLKSELNHKKREMRYYEKSDNGQIYASVLLDELAAGYRGILTMIGDMMIRLSENVQNSLEDLQGIVLIDEFDAHLHPKYQYELPKLLSEIFPKVQFIVSTHSPIPLLGVKPNTSIVLTVHRTAEAGITVERLDDDIEIRRLSVNALLSSPIFNFPKIFAEEATPESIIPENDYSKVPKSAKLALIKQKMKTLNLKPSA
jgi:predicted ATPase